jgi:hypothetical protein
MISNHNFNSLRINAMNENSEEKKKVKLGFWVAYVIVPLVIASGILQYRSCTPEPPVLPTEYQNEVGVNWEITIWTSNVKRGGTDSAVLLTIYSNDKGQNVLSAPFFVCFALFFDRMESSWDDKYFRVNPQRL